MDQDNQNQTSQDTSLSGSIFDDSEFDEQWEGSLHSQTEKKPDIPHGGNLSSLANLSWDDLENDDDVWDSLEEKMSSGAVEKTMSNVKAELAKLALSDGEDSSVFPAISDEASKENEASEKVEAKEDLSEAGKKSEEEKASEPEASEMSEEEKAMEPEAGEKSEEEKATEPDAGEKSEEEIKASEPEASEASDEDEKNSASEESEASEEEAKASCSEENEDAEAQKDASEDSEEAADNVEEDVSDAVEGKSEDAEDGTDALASAENMLSSSLDNLADNKSNAFASLADAFSDDSLSMFGNLGGMALTGADDLEKKSPSETEPKPKETKSEKKKNKKSKSEAKKAKSEAKKAKAKAEEAKSEEAKSDVEQPSNGINPEEGIENTEGAEEADGEIRLSERARLGRMVPENEVEVSEHVLHPEVYYSDEECRPSGKAKKEKDNGDDEYVEEGQKHNHALFWVAILLLFLICVCAYFVSTQNSDKQVVNYAQKTSFQTHLGKYHHMTKSKNGNVVAMCSHTRGIVEANGKLVAEFWPTVDGCRELVISDDEKVVWYVDAKNGLHKVDLEKDQGFNSAAVIKLEGYAGKGFDVSGTDVVYLVPMGMNQPPVVRHVNLLDGSNYAANDVALPVDAIPCHGVYAGHYAYISENSIHLLNNGQVLSASLDAPKLGCTRDTLYACVADSEGRWSVLCRGSLRQGEGSVAKEPVQIADDTGLRADTKAFRLMRSAEGTDLVTASDWYHVDARNNLRAVHLSQNLSPKFDVVASDASDGSLVGISDGVPMKVTADGVVSLNQEKSNLENVASFFVGGSQLAVLIDNHQKGMELVLWDISQASLVANQHFATQIQQVNVSPKGQAGFVVSGGTLSWMNWKTGSVIGTHQLSLPVADVTWDEDERHALIRYNDNSWELFSKTEDGVTSMRQYPSSVVIAFARSGLLWHYENERLRTERIGDGVVSTVFTSMTEKLRDISLRGIVMAERSNIAIFWGEKGLLTMNVETGLSTSRVSAQKAIEWVTPDRYGKFAVTSAGILELSTGMLLPLSEKLLQNRLHWIGSDTYLASADGRAVIERESGKVMMMAPRIRGIQMVGANSGFHADSNIIPVMRDGMISLASLEKDGSQVDVGVFSGTDTSQWCWKAANGRIQGMGSVCSVVSEDPNKPTLLKSQDTDVIASTKTLPQNLLSPFTPATMKFSNDVSFSLTSVPEDAMVMFSMEEGGGELPKELVFEDDITSSPVNVQLKNDSREVWATIVADGYDTRIVTFRPEVSKLNLRVPLLKEGADKVGITWHELDLETNERGEAFEVSEDLEIEMKSAFFARRQGLLACMRRHKVGTLKLILNNSQILPDNEMNQNLLTCIAPSLIEVNEAKRNGAFPELSDMASTSIDITLQ